MQDLSFICKEYKDEANINYMLRACKNYKMSSKLMITVKPLVIVHMINVNLEKLNQYNHSS